MLGKSTKPVIEILTGSFVCGNRAGLVDFGTSPRGHMEAKTQSSPRGLKSFDLSGVGLGIVAALEKSGSTNKVLFGRILSRSNPVPVKSPNDSSRSSRNSEEIMEMESLEEYTIVTCYGPNKSYTKVYTNGVVDDNIAYRIQSSVLHISPAKIVEVAGIPAPDFLSACNLCRKELYGLDIYMYMGEKAFCSTECRYRQMAMDERLDKCSSEASSRPVEVVGAGSPYAKGQILTNGILAI